MQVDTALTFQTPLEAWERLTGASAANVHVEVVRPKAWTQRGRGMYVFKLEGLHGVDVPVAAVLCSSERAAFEGTIYSDVLPTIDVSRLRYFGSTPDVCSSMTWQFIEFAEGGPICGRADRALWAGWIGRLHAIAGSTLSNSLLPDRGIDFHDGQLQHAIHNVNLLKRGTNSTPEQRRTIELAGALLDSCRDRWDRIACAVLMCPSTLVHGDLKAKNVAVRDPGGVRSIVAFDWELAGWGPIAVDLGASGVHRDVLDDYAGEIRRWHPELSTDAIARMGRLGELLRAIVATRWASESFGASPLEKVLLSLSWHLSALRIVEEL